MPMDQERIFKHFKGMKAEHEKKIAEYHRFMNNKDQYNKDFIQEQTDAFKEDIQSNVIGERVAKAKEEVEAIKKEMKTPKDKPMPHLVTDNEKLLHETKRQNDLTFLRSELDAAGDASELQSLHEQNHDNPDFRRLFNNELKKRARGEDGTKFKSLKAELEADPPEFKELNKLWYGLNFLGNTGYYPEGVEENGFESVEYKPLIPKPNQYAPQ